MTGPYESIIGMDVERTLRRYFGSKEKRAHEVAEKDAWFCGFLVGNLRARRRCRGGASIAMARSARRLACVQYNMLILNPSQLSMTSEVPRMQASHPENASGQSEVR